MDIIQIIALGVIQGLTEFLPISSSAHLVLISIIAGWEDQGLMIDVAAHAGSLVAVLIYFRKELREMGHAMLNPKAQGSEETLRLISAIAIATIPIVIASLLLAEFIETYLRSAHVIALMTILFALFLAYADRTCRNLHDEYKLCWKGTLFIGCAQVFALIPGTSRSGVVMTAAMMMGLTKVAAARFSFLLSIPTILGAIAYNSVNLLSADLVVDKSAAIGVFILSGIVAYLCIEVFVRIVNVIGMMPFVVYRLILGVLLFAFI